MVPSLKTDVLATATIPESPEMVPPVLLVMVPEPIAIAGAARALVIDPELTTVTSPPEIAEAPFPAAEMDPAFMTEMVGAVMALPSDEITPRRQIGDGGGIAGIDRVPAQPRGCRNGAGIHYL